MKKIDVTAVSYLNTKPFLYGLEQSTVMEQISLSREIPVIVAENLVSRKAAIGLVPVAIIPDISGAEIISDYCIGSDGEVGSVCICSQVPLEDVRAIYLDYQSRTSVELAKILLRDFWKVNPEVLKATQGYESKIENTTAGLIIGDRCLQLKKNFTYSYDLGKTWKDFTGFPFVYACWVANQPLPQQFVALFNEALKMGIENVPLVAKQSEFFYPGIDTLDYLSNKIQYHLTDAMREGMETFLRLKKQEENLSIHS